MIQTYQLFAHIDAGRDQVVQPTYSPSNLHQSGDVAIDLELDQSNEKDEVYEAEVKPSNKRRRVNPRQPEKDANACLRWLKSCTKDNEQLKW